MTLPQELFHRIQELVHKNSGMIILNEKKYFVEMRLANLLEQEKIPSFMALEEQLQTNSIFIDKLVNAMMIHESSFFRDIYPFTTLCNHVIPKLIKQNAAKKTLNIWCAACSKGQEAYSIAILLQEYFPELLGWKIRMIATDISPQAVDYAQKGIYSQLEVNRGLPVNLLVKYFVKRGRNWQLSEHVRNMILFRQLNLLDDVLLPEMDIIFLRNVLIYFDQKTKDDILRRVYRLLGPDSFLFLGISEAISHQSSLFTRIPVGKSCYYRPNL